MPTVPQQQRDQAKPGRTSWRRHAASWPLWGGCLEGRSGTFRQMKLPKQSSGTGEQSQVLRESGPRPPDTSQAFGSQRLGAPENPRARMPWCQGARVPGCLSPGPQRGSSSSALWTQEPITSQLAAFPSHGDFLEEEEGGRELSQIGSFLLT